jgi:hypothetical protein
MEFTLYYRGELKANRGPKDKHKLRRHFHEQLKELWDQAPLNGARAGLLEASEEGEPSIVKPIGTFEFAPLVCSRLRLVADLRMTLLRPESPGRIVTQAGDIDNRLKTLLDALTMPHQPNALPPGESPSKDESPFFCLFEDDNLITRLDVSSDRLLDPAAEPSEVVLLIYVRTRPTATTWFNIDLL